MAALTAPDGCRPDLRRLRWGCIGLAIIWLGVVDNVEDKVTDWAGVELLGMAMIISGQRVVRQLRTCKTRPGAHVSTPHVTQERLDSSHPGDWSGTLVRDEFAGYESMVKLHDRKAAGCLAHARRKFDELIKDNQSTVALQAVQRIAWIYRIEREVQSLTATERLAVRQSRSKPLWEEMRVWLQLERRRVPDGSGIAGAIDYSLNHWAALTANLQDGNVPVDNNHCENRMRPWAVGRRSWLFAGSELAGQRAAVVMSLAVSVKLNGHDPWAYLKDVLTRLPTQPNGRIDELLPHLRTPPN